MLEVEAYNQCLLAIDEAQEECEWYTPVRFKQWGFAERYLYTADKWISF